MQEAGADAVLETAFTLADGLEYCRTGQSLVNMLLVVLYYFEKYLNFQLILSYQEQFLVECGIEIVLPVFKNCGDGAKGLQSHHSQCALWFIFLRLSLKGILLIL